MIRCKVYLNTQTRAHYNECYLPGVPREGDLIELDGVDANGNPDKSCGVRDCRIDRVQWLPNQNMVLLFCTYESEIQLFRNVVRRTR